MNEPSFTAVNWKGQVLRLVMPDCVYDIRPNPSLHTTLRVVIDEVGQDEITITQLVRGVQTKTIQVGARIWFSMYPNFVGMFDTVLSQT